MKTRTVLLTLALCLVGISLAAAEDANMGTWKLNEAKSKFAAGATKNSTVVYEAAGDDVKVTVDGTDKDGKAAHNERPRTECLADVVVRMLPYWYDAIVPDLNAGQTVLVVAHGNSLRALVKHLDGISRRGHRRR